MTVTFRGYRVHLSKAVLVLLGLLVSGGLYLAVSAITSSPAQGPVPLAEPAFPVTGLPGLKSGWLTRWQKAYGTVMVSNPSQYLTASTGTPMQLNVFIPDPSLYPGYSFQGKGFVFMNGLVLEQTTTFSLTDLAAASVALSDPHIISLGFPANALPPPGSIYQMTGLLYWRADYLFPAIPGASIYPLPVFLISSQKVLQPAEFRAPATQSEELGLRYTEAGQEVTLDRVEWAAGRELRLLVTIRNLTTATESVWQGVTGSTAQLPQQGTVGSGADPDSPLSRVGSLAPQQSVRGYIIFGSSTLEKQGVADPNQTVTLRLPSLGSSNGDLIFLRVKPTAIITP
jgi:hypothetical protein